MEQLAREHDVLEIHFIEMKKFIQLWHERKLNPLDNILMRWLLLLGMGDARKERVYNDIYQELEVLAMEDSRLADAFSAWEELSQTPESIIAYESRLKKIIDDEAKIDYARHKGREEAKEDLARNMLKDGLPVERVAKYAELSIEQVEKIQSEMQ